MRQALLIAASAAALCAFASAGGAAPAAVPAACKLLTQQSVQSYFGTIMVQASKSPKSCQWESKITSTYKSAHLTLTTFALASNAQSLIKGECKPRKGVVQLSLPGAAKACGSYAPTGLCITPPAGESQDDYCLWEVQISFLRGSTLGTLELASLKVFNLNTLKQGVPFARALMKRWK
jgi:hypothetical protein